MILRKTSGSSLLTQSRLQPSKASIGINVNCARVIPAHASLVTIARLAAHQPVAAVGGMAAMRLLVIPGSEMSESKRKQKNKS